MTEPKTEREQKQPALPLEQVPLSQVIADLGEEVKWAIARRKVHFTTGQDTPPWCAQRKGDRARPLVRVAGIGTGVEALLNMKLDGQILPCMDCLYAARK